MRWPNKSILAKPLSHFSFSSGVDNANRRWRIENIWSSTSSSLEEVSSFFCLTMTSDLQLRRLPMEGRWKMSSAFIRRQREINFRAKKFELSIKIRTNFKVLNKNRTKFQMLSCSARSLIWNVWHVTSGEWWRPSVLLRVKPSEGSCTWQTGASSSSRISRNRK